MRANFERLKYGFAEFLRLRFGFAVFFARAAIARRFFRTLPNGTLRTLPDGTARTLPS